ncbi:MAG: LVIVD repeat-containing protein [Phycisphaerae bacterium]
MNVDVVRALDARGGYVRVEGRYLFLTSDVNPKAQQPGFWFDIDPDPAAPVLLDKTLPGAWDVAVAGDHAFVCDYTTTLLVWSLRDRQRQEVAQLSMPSMTENITIRGKLAYIANHSAGMTVVDIADPARPSIVGRLNPRIDCDGLALWKDYAVLYGHWESRLVLVDITDPATPRQVGVYQHDKGSFNQGEVEVENGYAYCTSVNGLVIVNINDPANPKLAASVDLKGVTDVIVKDRYAFVAAGGNGVRVLDISDPSRPVEVGRYISRGTLSASQVAVHPIAQAQPRVPGHAPATTSPGAAVPTGYYVYIANTKGPALVLLFKVPARKSA